MDDPEKAQRPCSCGLCFSGRPSGLEVSLQPPWGKELPASFTERVHGKPSAFIKASC